jgi:hypothetical protein
MDAALTKAEKGQDHADDDDQADDVDDGVHDFLLELLDAPTWASSEHQS